MRGKKNSYFSSGQEQDYLLVVNSTTKGLSLESPEKPIIKLQTTCFEKLIFALRRYKANCGTRNRPEKLQDFCETGPSRSEVRRRPTWGKRLEITSFPGCLLNTFPGEGKGATRWLITSTFGTEIFISFFLSRKSRTCHYLCKWNNPAGFRNAQA